MSARGTTRYELAAASEALWRAAPADVQLVFAWIVGVARRWIRGEAELCEVVAARDAAASAVEENAVAHAMAVSDAYRLARMAHAVGDAHVRQGEAERLHRRLAKVASKGGGQ